MSVRCFADNYLSEGLIVPSSMPAVALSPHVEAYAAGSFSFRVEGTYTDTVNRDYLIYCSFGSDVFPSRFDWSDDGGVTFVATDIEIQAGPSYTLNHGLSIIWQPGTYSPNLVTGDHFRFHVERPYRPALALDLKRDTSMRSGAISGGGTWTATFPFAVATTPDALVIFDHNFASNTTLRLQGSTTSNFAATPFNEVVTWAASKILYRVPANSTYAYWRLHVTVVGAVDYLEMSNLYLGSELAFSREFDTGFQETDDLMGGSDASILARGLGRYGITPKRWELTFSHRKPADDLLKFNTLRALTRTARGHRPFFFWFDSVTSLEVFELLHIEGAIRKQHTYLDAMTPSVSFLQVVRTEAA